VLLRAVAGEVVEFPGLAVLGDELPVAIPDGPVALVLPEQEPPRQRLAGKQRREAQALRGRPGRRMPAGQWAISGVAMPPSWTQCLCLRKGVFDTVDQARP